MFAIGRKRTSKSGYFSSTERPLLVKADVQHHSNGCFQQSFDVWSRWVDWFNNKRLLEPIGNLPLAELDKAYYEQLDSQAEAA